ncbi:molybdate ABC transporter permease subunit [Luteipulveratus sp. YIM 133132]|uniref:molybdate ABC transporter permease subunit n=1 Tax=Luteipulveratus flavus TaxID=3031728 RepID=UPI0023B1D950|nr:molybdate ABC transporter permease subunit [Luteipulveratus sp. YIM 133132]MDE9367286.1 molybdate ABC transporter permease subunit [Luteipulveratus sp. YIM 133132]
MTRERATTGGPGAPARSVLAIPAALALVLLLLPLVALLSRVRWGSLGSALSTAGAGEAVSLSIRTTLTTVVLSALLGTPLAWVLARSTGRWLPWLRAVVTVPLVLPPVVGGVALLVAWGREGLVGGPIHDWFGWTIPYSWVRVVLAETFVSMPFYVLAVEGAMRALDGRYDAVAATLGASPWRTFRSVVVPMVLPGVAAGATLAWARALGEFGATITFAGSFPGRTQTAPLAVYQALEIDPDAATALSMVMLLVCVAVLALLRGRWWR